MRRARASTAKVAAAAALAVALLAAGAAPTMAGDNGGQLSAKQFRTQAERICGRANAQLGEIADQTFGGLSEQETPDPATLAAYVAGLAPVVEDQIDAIADLRPPEKLAKQVKKLLRTARQELASVAADPTILLESNPFGDTNRLSSRLALPTCAGEEGTD